MTRHVQVLNPSHSQQVLLRARWCSSFACRLRGLMFRRKPGPGLVLVQAHASRWDSAIHMWFVFFPLGIAWLDDSGVVIGTVLARPWRVYVPSRPARYVVESTPDLLECVGPGDRLEFRDV